MYAMQAGAAAADRPAAEPTPPKSSYTLLELVALIATHDTAVLRVSPIRSDIGMVYEAGFYGDTDAPLADPEEGTVPMLAQGATALDALVALLALANTYEWEDGPIVEEPPAPIPITQATLVRMTVSIVDDEPVVVVVRRVTQGTDEHYEVFVDGGLMGDGSDSHTAPTLAQAMNLASAEAMSILTNPDLNPGV